MSVSAPGVSESVPGSTIGERPTSRLHLRELIQISIFWFTTNAIWGGQDIFQQERSIRLLTADSADER